MLPCAISHSTALCNRKGWAVLSEDYRAKCQKMPKVQNVGSGSVAYRSDYSVLHTGSSFVAVNCLFSLTLYSFSILLNVSSDKRERDFSSACARVGTTRSPSHHWSSHRRATPRSHSRHENSPSALVCQLLKINQLHFHCRTAVTGNSTFLENPSYWQVPRKLARNSNYNYCLI